MSTLFSVLIFFVLFGAMFGLPVLTTILFVRHREQRLQQVLREIKKQYRLKGRGRAQLVGRLLDKPLRITRDVRRGVVVSVDLLPKDVRRRHAQWSRGRAASFSRTQRRLLTHSGARHAQEGERVEGRWTFVLGAYPTTDMIEDALESIRRGITEEVSLAELAAAASEASHESARAKLTAVSESDDEPSWLRAEAYRALIGDTAESDALVDYGRRLAESPHPSLRRLSAVAWDKLPDDQARVPMRALLGDEHPTVVETAARLLAARSERDDQDAEMILLRRLKDASGPLLFVIVRALGAVGSSRALAELGRWYDADTMSTSLRDAVWRESTRIRSALGLHRTRDGGNLSLPPGGGELSPPSDG